MESTSINGIAEAGQKPAGSSLRFDRRWEGRCPSPLPLIASSRRGRIERVFAQAIALALLCLAIPDSSAQPFTERNPAQDFNTLGVAGGNKGPQGVFGVNGIMLVSDVNGRIYSYDLESKQRQDDHHNDVFDLDEAAERKSKEGGEGTNSDDFILYKDGSTSATNTPNEVLRPFGLWANGSTNGPTLWVAHKPLGEISSSNAPALYAYSMTWHTWQTNGTTKRYLKGTRIEGTTTNITAEGVTNIVTEYPEDFTGLYNSGNHAPTGIWSDGATMWVADQTDNKLYAYDMKNNKVRDPGKDIELSRGGGVWEQIEEDQNAYAQGLWSDGTTMWVANTQGAGDAAEKRIYAYDITRRYSVTREEGGETKTYTTLGVRVPGKDYETLNAAGNDRPRGIWSNGEMMWVADQTDNKLYAYYAFRDTTERNPNEDFETLINAGNHRATGIWSNRTNLWVADIGADKLYAYDLVTKDRVPSEDFNTLSTAYTNSMGVTVTNNNNNPTGLWSDHETMWVVDRHLRKVFAYKMSDKSYDESKGIPSLASANSHPLGLWANGTTMWVSDRDSDVLHAYNMWTNGVWDGSADSGKNINVGDLVGGGEDLFIWDIWSDGTTLWALEFGGWNGNVPKTTGHKIYAFTLPHGERAAARDAAKDYDTLDDAGNHIPHGLWSDGETMWVSDDGKNKIYAYNALKVEARLGSLTLTGHVPSPGYEDFEVDLIPSFNRGTTNYNASVPYATERLTVLPKALRPIDKDGVSYSPLDHDLSDGYQVSLEVGNNPIFITVTNGNTNLTSLPRTRTYTIDVEREFFTFNDPTKDILVSTDFTVQGIWANETNLWVTAIGTNKLYAYNKASRDRDSAHDIPLASTNVNPRGIWSNGATIWVADAMLTNAVGKKKLFAYKLRLGDSETEANRRVPGRDIDLAKTTMPEPSEEELKNNDNSDPEWIWSDGSIMWVSNNATITNIMNGQTNTYTYQKIYAYNMSDGTRNESREIDLSDLSKANDSPQGLWSDGENLWVANGTAGNVKLYAYKLAGERIDCRDETKDFNTLETAGNLQPKGIFSDGATMYVVDSDDSKIYAYNQPLSDNASLRRVELSDVYYADETFNDYFQNARRLDFYPHAYVLYSTNATTTISNIETQDPRVNFEKQGDDLLGWKIQSPADADPNTAGHQVRLKPGDTTEITIIVTAQSGASREHIIRIANDPSGPLPFRNIDYTESGFSPYDLWGDGTTMWISSGGHKLRAYNMDETGGKVWGAADQNKDLSLLGDNSYGRSIWANGSKMWVANIGRFSYIPTKICAYDMITNSTGKITITNKMDISFANANSKPTGIWSDGTTLWVADGNTIQETITVKNEETGMDEEITRYKGTIFAYNLLSDGSRVSETDDGETTYPKDITIDLSFLGAGYELADIWSNGTTTNSTMWVLVKNDPIDDITDVSRLNEDRALYAYKWGFGNAERDENRDISLRKGVSSPHYLKGAQSIFSHDGIMYVVSREAFVDIYFLPDLDEEGRNQQGYDIIPHDYKVYAYQLPTVLPPSGNSGASDNPVVYGNLILKGLSLSGISLSPAFSPNHLYYTASVEFDVASTTVTAIPNDSEASVSILWNVPGSSWADAGQGPQVSLREGDNFIIVEVTAANGFSRLRYFIEVTQLEAPPVSGGPLPLSFQPSSSATPAGKSRLIAADSLPESGVRFVFLVPAGEFQIEETIELLGGNWRPLAKEAFQSTRESIGQGQDRLTVILPKAEGKHRFLRLAPAPSI